MTSIAKTIKDQTDSILRRRQVAPGSSVTVRGGTTEPGTGAGTPPEIVDPNSDLTAHKASADHDGRYYTEDEVDALIADIPDGGVSAFTELSDVPDSYTGQQGKFTRVKSTENGLEFVTVTPGSGASAFTELSDTPSSFAGQGGKVIAVNAGGTALEFVALDTESSPTGDGTEDTNTGTLASSGDSYTASVSFIEILSAFWLASVKYYANSAGDVTVNVRSAGGELLATKTVSCTGSAWNTFTFDDPVFLTQNGYYAIEIKFASQKILRISSQYTGTLWKMLSHRTNNFFTGSASSSLTMGIGLIEYDDTP